MLTTGGKTFTSIAIWVNTNLRKHTNKMVVSHVQKLYLTEMNKLTAFMKENGFELSREETCLMIFNNGQNRKSLPQIELDGHTVIKLQTEYCVFGCVSNY